MITWNIVKGGRDAGIGHPNSSISDDTRANFQRLLNVPESRYILGTQNENADVHLITSVDWFYLNEEVEFAKKMKQKGKKVIAGLSADGRWLTGHGLLDSNGRNYTELLEHVDLILGCVGPSWKVYGRYQPKVIDLAEPFENFSIQENKTKDIDVLFAGTTSQLPYSIETAHMLLEKHPEYKCVIGLHPSLNLVEFRKQNPKLQIEITHPHKTLEEYLKRTKVVANLEMKPRSGRVAMWSYYANVPVICSSGALFSQLYPDLAFSSIDLDLVVEKIEYSLSNKEKIMDNAKILARPHYFPEWIKAIYKRLGA